MGDSRCRAFDAAAPNGIGERINRVADQAENMPDADLFEGADKRHECLQNCEVINSLAAQAPGPLSRSRAPPASRQSLARSPRIRRRTYARVLIFVMGLSGH